jgi:hypothetical protein
MKRIAIISLSIYALSVMFDSFPFIRDLPNFVRLWKLCLVFPIIYVLSFVLKKVSIPYAWVYILPLFLLMYPSVHYMGYESSKLTEYLTVISALSFTAPVLLNEQKSLYLFFKSTAILGLIITCFAVFHHQIDQSRMVINEGNPIWLSRSVSFVFYGFHCFCIIKK